MKNILAWLLFASGAALAADDPEAVYRKIHAAALARNLDELRLYAAEARRADLALPEVPKTYKVTGKAARGDGNAVELRATGTADSVGLGYTQMFGVIDLVKEKAEWRLDRMTWSTQRPGEYPNGYVIVQGPSPEPRTSGDPQAARFRLPPTPPEPSRIVTPKRTEPARAEETVLQIERAPAPCVIKPVMTDEDLRACGAHISD
jgi:hypothetical protein